MCDLRQLVMFSGGTDNKDHQDLYNFESISEILDMEKNRNENCTVKIGVQY